MKLKPIICLIIIFISFTSCKKYSFSKSDLKWQPYNVGDILIFESNKNEIDTIFITNISSHFNPIDNQSFFSDTHETLFVSGQVSLPNNEKKKNREFIQLLRLDTGPINNIKFSFNKKYDSLKYPTTVLVIDELIEKYNQKPKLSLYNSIKIQAKDYYNLPFNFDLINFHWSKEFGYVRYEFKNNYYWELKKFIRNNKNILN